MEFASAIPYVRRKVSKRFQRIMRIVWHSSQNSLHVCIFIRPLVLFQNINVLIISFRNCACFTCSFAGSPQAIAKKTMAHHICSECKQFPKNYGKSKVQQESTFYGDESEPTDLLPSTNVAEAEEM